jgi:hypothetical protein
MFNNLWNIQSGSQMVCHCEPFIIHLVKSLSISRWVLASDNAPTRVPSLIKGAVQAKLPHRIFQTTSHPIIQTYHTFRSFRLKYNWRRPITFAQCMLLCVTPVRIGSPIEGNLLRSRALELQRNCSTSEEYRLSSDLQS